MAQSEAIQLRAQAKDMGIDGYRRMSLEELRKAVGSGGSRRKSGNSTGPKRKSAAAITRATGAKRKTGTTAPAAKSTRGKAKRPSTAGRKRGPGRPKGSTTKTQRGTSTRKQTRSTPRVSAKADAPGRNPIDGKSVDWSQLWGGGKTGNRGEIFKLLRKYKGNKQKVFDALSDRVLKMYPRNKRTGERYTKADALKLLRWHIGRIAFDYVMATGQHEISENRAAYGKSKAPTNTAQRKPAGASRSSGSSKGGRKSTPARGSRQKAS